MRLRSRVHAALLGAFLFAATNSFAETLNLMCTPKEWGRSCTGSGCNKTIKLGRGTCPERNMCGPPFHVNTDGLTSGLSWRVSATTLIAEGPAESAAAKATLRYEIDRATGNMVYTRVVNVIPVQALINEKVIGTCEKAEAQTNKF